MDNSFPAGETPPDGLCYVPQGNYYLAHLDELRTEQSVRYLYSDSATSCIILIVCGTDRNHQPIVALTHLGNTRRFQQFFQFVEDRFAGPTSLYAQGANPPHTRLPCGDSSPAQHNTRLLLQWIAAHHQRAQRPISGWYVEQCSLSLGQGLPQHNNQDCYGIDLKTLKVSNQRFSLSSTQRDPMGGLQTLYCIFGQETEPPLELHQTGDPFTQEQITQLVTRARAYRWDLILHMTDQEILAQFSSTPDHEVPWFVETMRQSAQFIQDF